MQVRGNEGPSKGATRAKGGIMKDQMRAQVRAHEGPSERSAHEGPRDEIENNTYPYHGQLI